MKQSLQQAIEDELPEADYPDFEPGDKIRVTTSQEIQGQQRKRHFEGVCIGRRGEGPDKTFKVRKVSFGVGVERIYPLHSPIIDEIEIVKKGKVRRAKLTYLEGRSAKDSRIEEERADLEELNRTGGTAEPAEDVEEEASEEEETEDTGDEAEETVEAEPQEEAEETDGEDSTDEDSDDVEDEVEEETAEADDQEEASDAQEDEDDTDD